MKRKPQLKIFFRQYDYFSIAWKTLTEEIQEKILEMIAGDKGIVPYEKITSFDSLKLSPENKYFFEKSEITSRFMNEKMFLFAKISLASFVYDIINTFCFPPRYM